MRGPFLFAQPWWVNLLVFVPFAAYAFFRKGLEVQGGRLTLAAVFATAMGFVESAVVIYLRAATGLLPGSPVNPSTAKYMIEFSRRLLAIEMAREAATIVMLVCVTLLAAQEKRERWAIFLWTFAFWDVIYYVGLRLAIGWPPSLATPDVLFLIPTPWFAPVWFPVLVSLLCMAAVVGGKLSGLKKRADGQAKDEEPFQAPAAMS